MVRTHQSAEIIAEKRDCIINAAIKGIRLYGYGRVKISHVARIAGVADGTIYLYFSNFEDLLSTILADETLIARAFVDELGESPTKEQIAFVCKLLLKHGANKATRTKTWSI